MEKAIIGKKAGMTQVYEGNDAVPVTVIESTDCVVVMKRKVNGENALQLGYERTDKLNKPQAGHFESRGIEPRRILKEFMIDSESELGNYESGDSVEFEIFEEDELVDVSGKTKGRGFQGGVKRWGFTGGPASHGGGFGRGTGSIGHAADPSRVYPGKKMPGHYGSDFQTVQNLRVVRIMPEDNLMLIKGSVPGPEDGILVIRDARKGEN